MTTKGALRLAALRAGFRDGTAARTREQAGLSCAEAGAAAGVAGSTVWRWERGVRVPHGAPALRYEELLRKLDEQMNAAAVAR